jgi:hypothetical protein
LQKAGGAQRIATSYLLCRASGQSENPFQEEDLSLLAKTAQIAKKHWLEINWKVRENWSK